MQAAKKMRQILAETPPSEYSEEETLALINEAIEETKGQYPGDAKIQATA